LEEESESVCVCKKERVRESVYVKERKRIKRTLQQKGRCVL
jgi:hypothetical protein